MAANNDFAQTIRTVEDMEPVARGIVHTYCEERGLDENDIPPNVWLDIITELYISLFKPCNKLLKTESNLYNAYDISKVEYVYLYIYKRLCDGHGQESSQKGFCDMIGMEKRTLYDWAEGRLSTQSSHLQEKIMADNEESLFALMKDRRINPMKILPKLNKVHGWNMPGTRSESTKQSPLNVSQLPQLGSNAGNLRQIAQNGDNEI